MEERRIPILILLLALLGLPAVACGAGEQVPAPAPNLSAQQEGINTAEEPAVVLVESAGVSEAESVAAFHRQSHYCDARAVAQMWDKSLWESKVALGNKTLAGDLDQLNAVVGEAYSKPDSPTCSWGELNYSYEQAVALAGMWGGSTREAKTRMAAEVSGGDADFVDQMLMSLEHGG